MLRKNPELRPSAAELLSHPHLQPYVLRIHLKLNSPRRNTYPLQWSDSNFIKKTRFMEPEAISIHSDREKRWSFSNDRALNPSASETEQDSPFSTLRACEFGSYLNQKFKELSVGVVNEDIAIDKSTATNLCNAGKTPGLTPAKVSATPRRQTTPSKIIHIGSKRDSLPILHTPVGKSSHPTHRASLPLTTTTRALVTPYRANVCIMPSPYVSVNAPRIDKIAEFPLASSEDHLFPIPRTSSTSTHCLSSSPDNVDCSITKDKCTIQVVDRTTPRPNFVDTSHGTTQIGSEYSEPNQATCVYTRSSIESSHRRFDTSSYQQRAEALEGLLEFSARLLQQERFEELGVLLKPFGPEKVSPRETAIWLAKSFKETAV